MQLGSRHRLGRPARGDAWTKTWIPHVIGGDSAAPITAASLVDNTGEVEIFTLTLKDVYGNPIHGYTVEWWIQGVGKFKTDGPTGPERRAETKTST